MHLSLQPLSRVHVAVSPCIGARPAHFVVDEVPFVHITILKLKHAAAAKAVVCPLTIVNRAGVEEIFPSTMALSSMPSTHVPLLDGKVIVHPEPVLQVGKPVSLQEIYTCKHKDKNVAKEQINAQNNTGAVTEGVHTQHMLAMGYF